MCRLGSGLESNLVLPHVYSSCLPQLQKRFVFATIAYSLGQISPCCKLSSTDLLYTLANPMRVVWGM